MIRDRLSLAYKPVLPAYALSFDTAAVKTFDPSALFFVLLACACGDADESDRSLHGKGGAAGEAGAAGSGNAGGGGAAGSGAAGDGGAGGGAAGSAGGGGTSAGSRCELTSSTVSCSKKTTQIRFRDVHYQVPLGAPPAAGWPVVFMFQGSAFSAELTWAATDALPFGAFFQTLVVKTLLDAGYAVITPEAKLDGTTFWDTNIPPFAVAWETSQDHLLMLDLFAAVEDGSFGPLDPSRWHATGISSGGYMSSRMTVAYPSRFRSIAIQSASYATCGGPVCVVPALDATHAPTLLLHGDLDLTVPVSTMRLYEDQLVVAAGVPSRVVTDASAGHEWIAAAPSEVLSWFESHP